MEGAIPCLLTLTQGCRHNEDCEELLGPTHKFKSVGLLSQSPLTQFRKHTE